MSADLHIPSIDQLVVMLGDLAVSRLMNGKILTVHESPEWFTQNVDVPMRWPAGSAHALWESAGSDPASASRLREVLHCARTVTDLVLEGVDAEAVAA